MMQREMLVFRLLLRFLAVSAELPSPYRTSTLPEYLSVTMVYVALVSLLP